MSFSKRFEYESRINNLVNEIKLSIIDTMNDYGVTSVKWSGIDPISVVIDTSYNLSEDIVKVIITKDNELDILVLEPFDNSLKSVFSFDDYYIDVDTYLKLLYDLQFIMDMNANNE